MQREREAREARQLDREIRAQERHYQSEAKKHKEAIAAAAELQKHATQVHTQLSQLQKHLPGTSVSHQRSPRESIDKSIISTKSTVATTTVTTTVSFNQKNTNYFLLFDFTVLLNFDIFTRIQKVRQYKVQRIHQHQMWLVDKRYR